MLSGLSFSSSRAQMKPQEPPLLDLSHHGANTTKTSGDATQNRKALGVASSGASPQFNTPQGSDVRVEVVNSKGEAHCSLQLHSEVLREQSDYFFNALTKKGGKEGGGHSEKSPATFSIQVSNHVPDPDIYLTVFRLFYLEDDIISEDILCINSVWKVLQILIVASELQFHACVSACVDYLESVPWNETELEDIMRLVPQLDQLQDALPVVDRLPVKRWDHDSLADALRMLLIRAVAFVDGLGGAKQGGHGGGNSGGDGGSGDLLDDTSTTLSDGHGKSSKLKEGDSIVMGKVDRESEQNEGRGNNNSRGSFSVFSRAGQPMVKPIPGTLECREAACSILRNHQGPLLPLKTKKALLRETFVDLLQCLWSEQRRQSGGRGEGGGGEEKEGGGGESGRLGTEEGEEGGEEGGERGKEEGEENGEAEESSPRGYPGDGSDWFPLTPEEKTTARLLPPALLESIYGAHGALTWLTKLMIEFSMADEVFKWLASDKGLLTQAVVVYQSAANADSATSSFSSPLRAGNYPAPSFSSMSIVHSCLLSLAAAILAKRVVVNSKMRTSFVQTWIPVLAEVCGTSAIGEPLLYGTAISKEDQATVLMGYNELVLTLPANDQHSVFQLWYKKLKTSSQLKTPMSSPNPQSRPSLAEGCWFTLSPSYKRWLIRLGTPCGLSGVEV